MANKNEIELEAKKIYFAIFHQNIPLLLSERFARLVWSLNPTLDSEYLDQYYGMIKLSTDLEAAEVTVRFMGDIGLLSKRFRAMIYLAETLPEHQHFFINEKSNFFLGIFSLAWSMIWTIYKLLKGLLVGKKN